jgi:hypothetical protein
MPPKEQCMKFFQSGTFKVLINRHLTPLRSAFFWFSQETRPRVKEANPSFSVGEISRELGRRWAEAAPEAKLK